VQFKMLFTRIHEIVYLVYPLIFSLDDGVSTRVENEPF